MFSEKIKKFLNKKIFGIKAKYLLGILLLFFPLTKKTVINGLKTTIIYFNIFNYEVFKIEESSSMIVYFFLSKPIYVKELDKFSEEELFNELKKEYYYGVE